MAARARDGKDAGSAGRRGALGVPLGPACEIGTVPAAARGKQYEKGPWLSPESLKSVARRIFCFSFGSTDLIIQPLLATGKPIPKTTGLKNISWEGRWVTDGSPVPRALTAWSGCPADDLRRACVGRVPVLLPVRCAPKGALPSGRRPPGSLCGDRFQRLTVFPAPVLFPDSVACLGEAIKTRVTV